jgi:hypothetical protein
MAWNLIRCGLILLCCYQVYGTFLDVNQAERMLLNHPERHQVTSAPVDIAGVVSVLQRRTGSRDYWLALLFVLALSPYK